MTDWMSKIQKTGDGIVADALPSVKTKLLKFPSPSLNWALSGGLAFGKVALIVGPEGSGKSLLAILAAAEVQREDSEAWVLWSDAEYSFDRDYAQKLGVDLKRLWLVQSNKPEDIFDFMSTKVWPMMQGAKGDAPFPLKLWVVDSIKSIRGPREDAAKSVNDHIMGDISQLLNRALRQVAEPMRTGGMLTIFINQVGEEMNPTLVMQGHKWHYPSGMALKHTSDYIVLVEKVNNKASKIFDETHKNISDVPIQLGHIIRCKIEKTRCGPPHLVAQFRLKYGVGVVGVPLEVAELAVNLGVVEKINNSTYAFTLEGTVIKVNGFANFVKKIADTPELERALIAAVNLVDLSKLNESPKKDE